jgi:flagellin
MSKIGTNQMAVNAQKAQQQIQRQMTKIMEKLSTGKRINKPNDDPAGLSISTKMTAQIRGFQAAAKNINDAIAMVQTVDGALGEQITLLQRMRELAVQSSTDTFSAADRSMMETEYDELVSELDRIADETKWNTLAVGGATGFIIQVGADKDMDIVYTSPDMDNLVTVTAPADTSVVSQASASGAITTIDADIATVNTNRAKAGAYLTRFEGALDNALEMAQNLTDTRSRILDTDYAMELAELAKFQIMQQAVNAMMAQANAAPSAVLAMLQ